MCDDAGIVLFPRQNADSVVHDCTHRDDSLLLCVSSVSIRRHFYIGITECQSDLGIRLGQNRYDWYPGCNLHMFHTHDILASILPSI